MYIMINAYDRVEGLAIRVVCTDEVAQGSAEAMHVAWKASCILPATRSESWPDVVALVAEAVLDLAYDRH